MQARIVSWNINSDRRVEKFEKPANMSEEAYKDYVCTANAFPDFAVAERFPMIAAALDYFRKTKKVELFALQEVEDSILPTLMDYLKLLGMTIIVDKYNPSKMAFNFVFAYDATLYQVADYQLHYLTESGKPLENADKLPKDEVVKHNLESPFGRSFQQITLINVKTNEKFVVSNVHLDMSNKHKLKATQKMCDLLAAVKEPCVILGDMNQGDFDVNEPKIFAAQIELFKKNQYHWDGEKLYKNKPNCTFVTLPYDSKRFWSKEDTAAYERIKQSGDFNAARAFFVDKIIEKKIPLCTTALDGVYSKNNKSNQQIKPTSCKAILFMKGKRVKPMPDADAINQLAVDSFKNQQCQFASDHLPVLVKYKASL